MTTATEEAMPTRRPTGAERFLELARRGRHRGASSGEQRAYRIAKAIIENARGIDDSSLSDLGHFAQCVGVHEANQHAREVLEMKSD